MGRGTRPSEQLCQEAYLSKTEMNLPTARNEDRLLQVLLEIDGALAAWQEVKAGGEAVYTAARVAYARRRVLLGVRSVERTTASLCGLAG